MQQMSCIKTAFNSRTYKKITRKIKAIIMRKSRDKKKTAFSLLIIFSLLLAITAFAGGSRRLLSIFAVSAAGSPTPTPQTPRPKRRTVKTETRQERDGSPNNPNERGASSAEANLARILASTDFNLIGLVGTVSPQTQTVPKNIPTAVLTSIQVPEGTDPAPIIAGLNPSYRIRGELSGPSFTAPRTVEARIGEAIPIPAMPNMGDHVVQNLRIVSVADPTGSTLAPVTPDSVGITVIDNILVTQVQVTEMTYEQIIQSGINLDSSNYNFYNFVIGLATTSGTVPIQIPVAMPSTGGQLPVVGNPVGGVGVSGVSVPLPDIVPVMLEGVDESGNRAPIELPGGGPMQIPGVVVFPGRIGLLHQFFEAIVIVANGAPNGTPLVITNLRARANLPNANTPNDPSDDPLRIAATQQGGVQTELEVHGLGPDGRYGTPDDTTSFNPGQSGQATFLLEGLREGLHTVDFNLEGTLQGLPSGNVTVRGTVPGAVLVRDAEFGVTFTHPSVVRAGQVYELGLTVFNSGRRNLNGIALNLRGDSVSGATLIDSETKTLTQTIAPGSSGTVKWRLRSNTTGQVTASYIKVGEGIDAGLNLVTGVGDRNVPLSPDSLILPEPVRHLPPEVEEAGRQMLGQAWSIATAPPGSLPTGVLSVDKQTVVGKAVELGWAGLRIGFHEDRDTSLRTLLRDWIGENANNSSAGFADALRNTPAGYYFFDVVGTKFYQTVGTESPADFHKKMVLAESSRSPFISAYVSQTGGSPIAGAKISSPTNQSVGFGANPNERFGDLRTGASLKLLETDPHDPVNNTKGSLLIVSKPATTGNWSLEINGFADGSSDVSILVPTTGKNYRQLVFGNVALNAGKRYRISFRATGTNAPIVEEFINGAFRPVDLPYTSFEVSDPNPEITGVVQVTEEVIEGGDKFGRLVGVLFSKPMVKTSVETLNRYQIGGGELVSDPTQIVGRLIKPTGAVQNFGGRFSILALDSPVGPFIKRTLTANGIVDASGKIISNSTKDIEMRVSPQGRPPGGYLTGRVLQADGTPVPNAGIYYQRMKASPLNPTAPCGMLADWETVSYQKADSNGEYTIDYVREGDCHPVTVRFQNVATNSNKTLVSNVAYNGQHLIFNAVFLARGNVQGTVTSGGVPLADANVSIISELDPLNSKLVKTNAQGFYSATGVPVGGVTVKAVGTGAYRLSSGIAAGTLSEAGGTVNINVATQNVSGVIRGRVLDGGGDGPSPVPNSLVVARAFIPGFPTPDNTPLTVGYAFTGPDGSFTIDKLPVGDVYLSAVDPQRGVSTSMTVSLTAQSPQVDGVILLISNGFGKVLGKVVNEIGQVIPNAIVQEGLQSVRADASGNYVLPRIREGTVSISARDPINTNLTGSTTVSVRRNEDTTGADIIIRRPANLNGQVFINQNGANTPLAGASVSADGFRIVRTDSQGRYTLNNVESGTNLILRFVHPQGRLFVNTNVYLNPGETLLRNAVIQGASRIHGRITQPDGTTPVVTGVSLKTVKPNTKQGAFFGLPEDITLTYQTTTDGLYAFENLNPTDYRVSASNVFFPVPVSQSGILPPNTNLEVNLSLVDTLAGKIHGHIYQPDGVTPVGAGVRVSLGGGSLADVTVRTDASGYYEFAEVFAAGSYILKATEPLTNKTNQTTVNIRKNEDMEVDLRLLGRGNLKVKVIDGGGVPLPTGSITVEGSTYPNDRRYIELTPGNNGEFEFTNLNEGNYAISALYLGLGGRVSASVTLGGNTEVTVQVQAVGSVTGRVFMPNGTTPVGLADVALKQNGRIIGLITTQDSEEERGKFDFGYVPTGEFTIEVFDNRSGRRGRSAGTITTQGQIATVNVNLLALGTVVGRVTANGLPVAHALVNLSADGSGISGTSRIATTDENGNFRYPGIPVGQVYLSVSGGPGGSSGNAQGFVTGTSEPLPDTTINVALTPTATVTGTVYRFGGTETYAGALVRVTSNYFSVNAVTDESGRYRVNFVPLGTVNVKVESPFGYDRGKSAPIVSNEPGATVTADVTMAGVGNLNGTTFASNGTPLNFGRVTFTNTAWGEAISIVALVQPDGTYSIRGVPAGDFSLKLTVPELVGVAAAADTLTGGQTLVKNLQLEQAGRIFGNVKSTDGTTPSVGADVTLYLTRQGGGAYSFITHTDANGNWTVDNLPLGTISVRIVDTNAGGAANLSGLTLSANGQQLDTGSVILDDTPIAVTSVAPANNAVNVPTNSTVQIIFSEPVDVNTINSGSVGLNFGNNSVSASQTVSTDGTTVTLTPSQNLAQGQTYTVSVTNQVKDRNGLSLAQAFGSSFATADETAPQVSTISPANGATQVPVNSSLVINTSEVIAADLNLSEVVRVAVGQDLVNGMLALDNTGRIITFAPDNSLSESTVYTVTVNGLRDLAGNVQTQAFTSNFTTVDSTPPTINPLEIDGDDITVPRPPIIAYYQDNSSGVNPASVVLTIDGVQITSGLNASSQSVSYVPTENLSWGSHTVTVRVADNAGNLSEVRTATFTISDRTPPTVTAVSPADNAREVALNAVVSVEFDEPLDANQNFSTIFRVTEFSQSVPENGSYILSGDGKTIIFTPANLQAGKHYAVFVRGQKDVFGNTQNQAFAGRFTTIDTTPPVISEFKINGRPAVAGMTISTPRPTFEVYYEDELQIDGNATKLYLSRINEPFQEVAAQVYSWRLSYQPPQPLEAGRYRVKAVVKDFGGNEAANNEYEFEFAPQQPEILSISPNTSPTSGNTVTTITGSQLISGIADPDDSQRGLLAEYFDCYYDNCLQDVKLVRLDETVNFESFDESIVPFIDSYDEAVRWRGKIIPRYTETYTLAGRFNGNFIVKINGQTVVNGRSYNVSESSGVINLEAGRSYDIEVISTHFYENNVGNSFYSRHVAQLSWSSPSQPSEIVPAEQLRPAGRTIAPTVTVGGQTATVIGAVSGETDQLAVVLPPHAAGSADVQIQNESGTATFAGGVEYYTDADSPAVSYFSPRNGATNSLPERVSVTFNEPLAAGQNLAEILKVYVDADNTQIAGQVTIDETNRRLRFVPSNPFAVNTTYRIVVRGHSDTVGNTNNTDLVSRFTVDNIAPALVLESPDGETILRRPTIRIGLSDSFSPLDLATRQIFVDGVNVTNNSTLLYPCTFFCNPPRTNYGISYAPPADLTLGSHTVRVKIADQAGNLADQTFSFAVVADQQPPTINALYVAGTIYTPGLRTAQRRPGVEIYFRDNGTITPQSQKLYFAPQGETPVPVAASVYRYSGSVWVMYYSPPADLPFGFYNYRYELVDDNGNTTANTIGFEVADLDITPPTVTAVNPEPDAVQISADANITLTFSEPLDPNQNFADSIALLGSSYERVAGSYQLNAAGMILTFTPSEPLAGNSRYTIYAYNYLDLAGNGGQYYYSSFATIDTEPPSIQDAQLFVDDYEWMPLNGAETFDRQPRISVSYGDATNGIDPNSIIFTFDGQTITDGVSAWGIEYEPPAPLSYGQHTITVRVADTIGNISPVKTETFTVSRDPRTPFAVEPDTVLLWHLDEADRYNLRLTPDAGNYRIHGVFPDLGSLAESKTVQKSAPNPAEKSAAVADFNPTSGGRFGGAISSPDLKSIGDSRISALGGNGLTIEGWMKMSFNEVSNPYTIWAKGGGMARDFELLLTPNGNLKARIYNEAGNLAEVELPKSTYDVTDNRWHSLAMTVETDNGTPSQLKLYVDGQMRAALAIPQDFGAIRTSSGGEFYVGVNDSYDSYYSMFDEVRLSSTAHTADTISRTYNSNDLGLTVVRHSPPVVPNDNTTELILEGYNLDLVTSANVTTLDGSPLPVTTTIIENSKTKLRINAAVDVSVPNGEVKLTVSNGQNSVVRNFQIVAQRASAADVDTPVLFNLNEPEGSTLINSGTFGGSSNDISNPVSGRFGNGRNSFSANFQQGVSGLINSSFTGELWVKTEMPPEDARLIVYGTDYDGLDTRIVDLTVTTRGQLKAVLTDSNDVRWEAVTNIGEFNLFDNQWHLVSMVVARSGQAAQNTLKIYVDGTERASSAMPAGFANLQSQSSYRLYLNSFRYDSLPAALDDFRLLNYARPATDIYNSWFGINNPGGVGVLLPKADEKNKLLRPSAHSVSPDSREAMRLNESKTRADNNAPLSEKKTPPKNVLRRERRFSGKAEWERQIFKNNR